MDYNTYFKEDQELTKHMRDLESLEETTLDSVKQIPKTSPIFDKKITLNI